MYNDDFDDEDYCGYEEDDNERDLFYTLTDGQYGDYDEWRRNGEGILLSFILFLFNFYSKCK